MTKVKLPCEFDGCTWESIEGELESVVKLLEIHVAAKHQKNKSTKATAVKAEKAKRPEIAAEVSDEDWAYFLNRWESYKKATNLEGDEVVLQLMECCCDQLRKDHYRNFPSNPTSISEKDILSQLKQLAVRAKNRAVNRVKLSTLHQDKGEPIRR